MLTATRTRILLADDHPALLAETARLLGQEHDVVGTVTAAMQFTDQEAAVFWPLYDQYRAEIQPQGDAVLKLVKDYAQLYPDIPDDRAKVMLKDLAKFEKERVDIRSSYLKKIGKVLSPAKTLRFAQVDSGIRS